MPPGLAVGDVQSNRRGVLSDVSLLGGVRDHR